MVKKSPFQASISTCFFASAISRSIAEYSTHYHEIVTALQTLVDSDQVQPSTVARLEMVPVVFLRKVPLLQDSEEED
jgi:hypothetical protein